MVDAANRRLFLKRLGVGALASTPLGSLASDEFAREDVALAAGPRPLVTYPEKRPLIRIHTRPPHLETPFEVFDESLLTPNDAFFVRYHLADFPRSIDPNAFRLTVGGHVKTPLELALRDLKALTTPEVVVAVNQCSGNSRGYAKPRVFGAQLGNGAMGNARWTGVPLRAVLDKAGVRAGATLVAFNGLDRPMLPTTPDFQKTLKIDHALSEGPLLAWGMNDETLPHLNGYPLKLIVPGYFGTYWVKHLSEITVLDAPFDGLDAYFMNTAYRLPDNDCLCVTPGNDAAETVPISRLPVRSFVTNLEAGSVVPRGKPFIVRGIAFDGGSGIRSVEIAVGANGPWQSARLGDSLGVYSFQRWETQVRTDDAGPVTLRVRATARSGEQQPASETWNHGGYRRNVIESYQVMAS